MTNQVATNESMVQEPLRIPREPWCSNDPDVIALFRLVMAVARKRVGPGDVEDAFQDGMLAVYRALPEATDPAKRKAFVCVVASNAIHSKRRAKGLRALSPAGDHIEVLVEQHRFPCNEDPTYSTETLKTVLREANLTDKEMDSLKAASPLPPSQRQLKSSAVRKARNAFILMVTSGAIVALIYLVWPKGSPSAMQPNFHAVLPATDAEMHGNTPAPSNVPSAPRLCPDPKAISSRLSGLKVDFSHSMPGQVVARVTDGSAELELRFPIRNVAEADDSCSVDVSRTWISAPSPELDRVVRQRLMEGSR